MNYPYITTIVDVIKEAENTKTILFRHPSDINPGQFYMIWIPGVDEIPMSVSHIEGEIKGFTFRKIGEATSALYNMRKDQKIGILGPYGNGFRLSGKKNLFVGGGTGIGMLYPAIKKVYKQKNTKTITIIGTKNKKELFYEEKIRNHSDQFFITTDNGSKGIKGFASDLAKEILEKEDIDMIFTCGPEKMMKKLMDNSKNISFQASLERYMKCGFGLCGKCTIGDGIRVCKEGPIFDRKTLQCIGEFGFFKKDSSGRKIKI